ncbi:MAG: hypothetical protein JWL84_541 [Rhodospirillales bacterium]|nr:hypothetical protein [Rhodospirillales bacterium]
MKKNPAEQYPWQRLPYADAQPLEPLTAKQRASIIKALDPRLVDERIAARVIKELEIAIRRYRAFRHRREKQILPTDQKASIKSAMATLKGLSKRLWKLDIETEKRLISSLGKELTDVASVRERFDLGEQWLIQLATDLALLERALKKTSDRTRPMSAGRNKNADVRTISEFLLEIWEKHGSGANRWREQALPAVPCRLIPSPAD